MVIRNKNTINNTVLKRYCYKCCNETNQKVNFETVSNDTRAIYRPGKDTEVSWVIEETVWSITTCKGCDSHNMEAITCHIGPNKIEREVQRKLIPGKSKKQFESWVFWLNSQYIELLSEIYNAFNNGSFRLAMMGLRTIIDMFIVENIGDTGTFKQKLQSLKEKNYINNKQFGLLETSIEAGNASAHRGFKPSEEVLITVIEIVEHLLKPLVMDIKLSNLKEEIPQRNKT